MRLSDFRQLQCLALLLGYLESSASILVKRCRSGVLCQLLSWICEVHGEPLQRVLSGGLLLCSTVASNRVLLEQPLQLSGLQRVLLLAQSLLL